VVRRSIAHPKQIPLRVKMDMVDIHCPSDNGSHSLFHPSTEEVTHVQMDTISGLNNCKILRIICHLELYRSFFHKSQKYLGVLWFNLLLEPHLFFFRSSSLYFSCPFMSTYVTLLRTSLNCYFLTSTLRTSFFSTH